MNDRLIDIFDINFVKESDLTSAFVICIHQNKLMIGFNNWRNQWEIPAGKREPNETIIQTAKREFFEETHHHTTKIDFKWIAKIEDKYSNYRYRALFLAEIDHFQKFIKQENDEMEQLALVDISKINTLDIDKIDLEILKKLKFI